MTANTLDISKLRIYLDQDEKMALHNRVTSLLSYHTLSDIERIIYSELDEVGLHSEDYMLLLDDVLSEFVEEELT